MYRVNEPSALFHALHHAHKRRVSEAQAARGLEGLGAPMLLLTLFRREAAGSACSQREVAKAMGLSPATVAVSLKPLERDGYVCRRTDARDARRNLVRLTDKGKKAVETCGEAFRAVDDEMLSGFSAAERSQLTGFFLRMLENLGDPRDFRPPPGFPGAQTQEKEEL